MPLYTGGNIYGLERPEPNSLPLEERLAGIRGGNPDEYKFVAERIRRSVAAVIEGKGLVVITNTELNEDGLHEVRIFDGRLTRDGSIIVRKMLATPEQCASGIFDIPKQGIFAQDCTGAIPDNVRRLRQ